MMKVQQLVSNDEIDAAGIGSLWMQELVKNSRPEELPGEITCERVGDTCITTLWKRNRPAALEIRQRDLWNRTVLTLVEIDPAPPRDRGRG